MNRRTALSLALLNGFAPAAAFGLDALGPEFPANAHTTGHQANTNVASTADGSFVMVWDQFDNAEVPAFDAYVRRFDARGNPLGKEFRVSASTSSKNSPSVAVSAEGDFAVVWVSQDGDGNGVYARSYFADGTPKGPQFRVNQVTADTQQQPRIAMDATGRFVVTWYADHDAPQYGDIQARCYDASGEPVTQEFRVNGATSGDLWSPAVAMSAGGDFVVTWTGYGTDTDSNIRARRFNAACQRQGEEWVVAGGPDEDDWQDESTVALDTVGDFVVVWDTFPDKGEPFTVHAQRYRADGVPRGDTFQVNTYTEGRQYLPRVAMDARGDFVVAWQSYGQEDGDTGNIGVYARGYRANGDPVGRPFRVNQSTNLDQRSASVALDADGDVVVVWSSEAVTHPSDALVRRFEGFSSVDLSLKQVDTPDPVQAGETLTVTLRASNLDAAATPMGYDAIDRAIDAASNVRIVSQLPAGATNVTAAGNNWACTVAGGVVDCDYKRLLRATDQSSVLTLQMTAPSTPEPTISTFSKVRADQPDPAPANNRETDATAVNN